MVNYSYFSLFTLELSLVKKKKGNKSKQRGHQQV